MKHTSDSRRCWVGPRSRPGCRRSPAASASSRRPECPCEATAGGDDPGLALARRSRTRWSSPSTVAVAMGDTTVRLSSDAQQSVIQRRDVDSGLFVLDADSHWCERPDLFTSSRPSGDPRPGASCRGGRRSTDVGVRRPPGRPVQRRRRHRPRRLEGVLGQGAPPVERRRDPRRRLRPEGAPRGARRVRHRRAGHLPEHHRPRRPGPRHGRRRGALPPHRRDLQRPPGRDPGRVEQPPAAAAADAGVGHRHLHRGGQAASPRSAPAAST